MKAEITRCPACLGVQSAPAFRVREYAFRRCRGCRTLFLENRPDEEALARLYRGTTYFTNPKYGRPEEGGYHGYHDYLADRGEITAKFDAVIGTIERSIGKGRLLDVGAGPGFLLSAAAARGWDALGVEPNAWAAAYARDEVGVDVQTAYLADASFEPASFDAVTLMDVLEHVDDPTELLEDVAQLLREGGVLAVLTPDAGSPVSRALGRRWPEVQRVPEHLVLYSARGLGALLGRCGFEVLGWHSIGKRSTVHTLLADVAPIAPPAGRLAQRLAARLGVADRSLELDPRTKLVLYAARRSRANGLPRRRQPRLRKPKLAAAQAPVTPETAVLEDLNLLASARNLCDWMFSQFEVPAGARVVEIGAGIGTFSRRLLDAGASELLLVEPEDESADVLERRFAATPNVRVVRELLPDSPSLRAEAGTFDLVLCQNVLEHVEDDTAAVAAMAGALVRGGRLSLLVPAHRFLFGRLDEAYGHYRRYTRTDLCRLLEDAGLRVERTYSFNALGVPGWLVANRRANGRIGTRSLELYDRIVPLWRRIEAGASLPIGLSLIAHGRKP